MKYPSSTSLAAICTLCGNKREQPFGPSRDDDGNGCDDDDDYDDNGGDDDDDDDDTETR